MQAHTRTQPRNIKTLFWTGPVPVLPVLWTGPAPVLTVLWTGPAPVLPVLSPVFQSQGWSTWVQRSEFSDRATAPLMWMWSDVWSDVLTLHWDAARRDINPPLRQR